MTENNQLEIECDSYRGFLFQSAQNRKIAEYKESIDVFYQNIKKPYDGSGFPKKLEEILAQAILIKAMPDHKIIKIDNGSESSQIDLMARKEENDIAIEITQFTEKNYFCLKSKEGAVWGSKETKRDWKIHINNNHGVKKISKKTIEHIDKCLSDIAGSFQSNEEIMIFSNSTVKQEIKAVIAELKEKGVTYIYSEKEKNDIGTIHLILGGSASFSIESPDTKRKVLKEIIEIAVIVPLEQDIPKKFKKYTAKEKHLFVPATFSFDKGQYIAWYLEYFKFFMDDATNLSIENLAEDTKENANKAFEIVDVIWISRLYDWTPSGIMGFSLIKIIKQGANFIFYPAFHQELYPNIVD